MGTVSGTCPRPGIRVSAARTAVCRARDRVPVKASQARRPEPHAQYLKLPEEFQTRYGLPEYPSCTPSAAIASAGNTMEELESLIRLLPRAMQTFLMEHENKAELIEVVMDLGRTPLARFPSGDVEISDVRISTEDLEEALSRVGSFGSDNRAGINETLHRISCLRNRNRDIIGLTCRVGRSIPGSAAMITDLVVAGCSILLLGRPGMGKTTAIREVSRLLAGSIGKRVVICDTSNEIGGDGDVPHPGIGRARRLQVISAEKQHEVMIEAVENHMPQVVVIDEIGTEAETQAARTISQRGVQLIATAHGCELENVIKNPSLVDLVGGIGSVTLGDDEARRRGGQKSVLERTGLPTFDVCIEMISRREWAVWEDVGIVVDMLLLGRAPPKQIRTRCSDGRVLISRDRISPQELRVKEAALASVDESAPPAAVASDSDGDSGWLSDAAVDNSFDGFDAPVNGQRVAQTVSGARSVLPPVAWDIATGASTQKGSLSQPGGSSVDPHEGWDHPGLPPSNQPRDALPFKVQQAGHAVLTDGPDGGGRQWHPDGEKFGGELEQSALKMFMFGVQGALVRQAASAVDPTARIRLVSRIKEAHLVLTTREKMRTGTGRSVRADAKAAKVPVLSLKNCSMNQCVSALRVVLGVDPAPGLAFSGPSKADRADPNYGTKAAGVEGEKPAPEVQV